MRTLTTKQGFGVKWLYTTNFEPKAVMRNVQSQTASVKIGLRHRRWLKCCCFI